MIRVLFVCLGNICRSPMAEAIFRQMVADRKLEDKIEVDSAGTGSWHIGEPPHRGTREILRRNGISDEGMRGRQVETVDLSAFDYVIAMDSDNLRQLRKLGGEDNNRVFRLLDLVAESDATDVPDPWFTGDFDEVFDLISKGCHQLLRKVTVEHNLATR